MELGLGENEWGELKKSFENSSKYHFAPIAKMETDEEGRTNRCGLL